MTSTRWHCELLLVQAGIGRIEVGVSVAHLRYGSCRADTCGVVAESGMHSAFTHGVDFASLMVGSRLDCHPSAIAAVASVGCDNRAVGGSLFANHNGGAGLSVDKL